MLTPDHETCARNIRWNSADLRPVMKSRSVCRESTSTGHRRPRRWMVVFGKPAVDLSLAVAWRSPSPGRSRQMTWAGKRSYYPRMRTDDTWTKRTLLGLNGVDRRVTRRSNRPGCQAAFRCRKLLYSAVSNSIYPPNDTGSPNGRICVAQKPPKPFLRSIQ
jgi:hypothetical protein